jgi:hypothetical protein
VSIPGLDVANGHLALLLQGALLKTLRGCNGHQRYTSEIAHPTAYAEASDTFAGPTPTSGWPERWSVSGQAFRGIRHARVESDRQSMDVVFLSSKTRVPDARRGERRYSI